MNGRFEWKIFRLNREENEAAANNEGIKSINDSINLFFRSSLMIIVHNMISDAVAELRKLMNANHSFNWISIRSRSLARE
jgi:hypothetical protein